jgi:hypothetical protein
MKQYYFLIVFVFLITGCNINNNIEPDPEPFKGPYRISNGCYMGNFIVKGQKLWSEICFDTITNKYVEWPSGGIMYQKEMGCLTVGTYSIDSFRLTFTLDSLKFKLFPCPLPESKLPGVYKIMNIVDGDSIIFEKGTGENKIIYFLKKVYPKSALENNIQDSGLLLK